MFLLSFVFHALILLFIFLVVWTLHVMGCIIAIQFFHLRSCIGHKEVVVLIFWLRFSLLSRLCTCANLRWLDYSWFYCWSGRSSNVVWFFFHILLLSFVGGSTSSLYYRLCVKGRARSCSTVCCSCDKNGWIKIVAKHHLLYCIKTMGITTCVLLCYFFFCCNVVKKIVVLIVPSIRILVIFLIFGVHQFSLNDVITLQNAYVAANWKQSLILPCLNP